MTLSKTIMGAVVLLLVVIMAACAAPTPTPTPTPVPPTATPIPPTVAPPASNPAAQGDLAQALAKAQEATVYRMNLNVTGKGNFAAAGGPTPEAGKENESMTLISMLGEVNGKDAHFVIQGLLTAFLGLDPTRPLEVISVNDVAYVKGPIPLIGATEEKWYKTPPEAAQIAEPPLSPSQFLNSFGESGINPADFKLSGSETLDGVQCEVYAGDKAAVVNAFTRLGGATGATQEDLDSIDNAEFKFWVCSDGYLHQIRMMIEGHDKNAPDQKGSFEILMKLSDFNGDVKITAPADAAELKLPTPAPEEPSATPTP